MVHELAVITMRGKLSAGRMPAAFRQLDANRRWFAANPPPAPLARVQLPGDPLVYGYYPGSGLVLQPLFNWTQANQLWFADDGPGMQALIDALTPLAVRERGGWLTWEYLFDYGGGKAPWR